MAVAGDRQLVLLVRKDQVAIGNAIHMNDFVHYRPRTVRAADMVLHEEREVLARLARELVHRDSE